MTTTINAVASTGLVQTSDGSGILNVQSNGVNTNAQAWVCFTGVSSVTVKNSYNVSSVTYVATGSYRVNFTNAFPDAFYVAAGGLCQLNTVNTNNFCSMGGTGSAAPTASSFSFLTFNNSSTVDATYTSIAFFR